MKKLIAMLACLTLVLTMFAGLTVSAAGEATMRAEFVKYLENAGAVYAQVKVYYEVPDTMVAFSSEEDFITGDVLWTGTGIAASQFGLVSSDAGFVPYAAAKSTSPLTASSALASKNGMVFSAGLVHSNCVATGSGLLGQVTFKVDPASYTNGTEITFSGDEFLSVRKVVANSASVTEYRLANNTIVATGCTLPAYQSGSSEYEVTYAAEDKFVWEANSVTETVDGKVKFTVKPAFGYKITAVTGVDSVIAEGGEMEATLTENTEINVTVANVDTAVVAEAFVDGSNAYVFGKANAAATAYGVAVEINGEAVNDPYNNVADGKYAFDKTAVDGAFGVAFNVTGKVFKGNWSVKAYADGAESEAVTFAIN